MELRKLNSNPQNALPKRAAYLMTHEEEAIIKTLAYSSIFSFPLIKKEIWKYLISNSPIEKKYFDRSLNHLSSFISSKKGYYVIRGHENDIAKRLQYLPEVDKKMWIAQRAATLLSMLPTVLFIGVSGGLAANNVTPEDDIDFFIIVQSKTMYISRFWILMLLSIFGLRRLYGQSHAPNKICVNLLVDENYIEWDEAKRDEYTAHEIAQIKPLFERNGMYNLFIKSNAWVTSFLPNAFSSLTHPYKSSIKMSFISIMIHKFLTLPLAEQLLRFLQNILIKRHQTTEIVSNHVLAFHPRDYRAETLRELKLKIRHLGLLTKK